MTEEKQAGDFLVLIADDNPFILELLTRRLERRGYRLLTASTGLEAAQKAYEHRPDAIILDLSMPEMTGFQVCRLLKTDDEMRDTPIIILTAHSRQYDEFWARMSGADYYLHKGKDDKRLLETLRELLRKRASRSARPATRDTRTRPATLIRKLNDLLEKELRQVTVLAEMAKVACHFADIDAMLASVLTILSGLTDSLWAFLAVVKDQENIVYLLRGSQESALPMDCLLWKLKEALQRQVPGAWRKAVLYGSGSSEERPLPEPPRDGTCDDIDLICLPFVSQNVTRGAIGVLFNVEDPPARAEIELLENSAPQVAITVTSVLLYDRMTRMATTDELTGIANRRAVLERLSEEMQRARRYETPLSVTIFDLDHFKQINDRYGHGVGDAVLRRVARHIEASARKTDRAGRIGGEEFLLIMPHTSRAQALTVADRIRAAIAALSLDEIAPDLAVTVSGGVAQMAAETAPEHLMARADSALYAAKRAGRNRVIASPVADAPDASFHSPT